MSEGKECRNNMCFGKGHQEKCLLRVSFGSQYAEAAQGVRISNWKLRTESTSKAPPHTEILRLSHSSVTDRPQPYVEVSDQELENCVQVDTCGFQT